MINMQCILCGETFVCTRKSPICATEKSRGFKHLPITNTTEYINGTWSEILRINLSKVNYKKLIPDKKFNQCICYKCYNTHGKPIPKIDKLFLDLNVELLHFYFGSNETLFNQEFPKDVKIVLICYGEEAITLEKL